MSWEAFKLVFLNSHNLALWVIPPGLAILLWIITHRYHHQLVFPLCAHFFIPIRMVANPLWIVWVHTEFIFIPTVFYIVVAAASLDLASLRANGWIFDTGSAGQESWYKFYSYFG
jgi:sulfate permease, SulP family